MESPTKSEIKSEPSGFDLHKALSDHDQYVNWFLVIIGWVIVVIVAYYQYKKSKDAALEISETQNLQSLLSEFSKKLESLEDEMIVFWMSAPDSMDRFKLGKFSRDIKVINKIARNIVKNKKAISISLGKEFSGQQMIALRRVSTNPSDADLAQRPLKYDQIVIKQIRMATKELRDIFIK